MKANLDARTVADFGEQWTRYTDNSGYYGSIDLLADIFGPLLDVERIKGMRVAEIGSGSGRVVNMLLEAGAAHVVAIEPSNAFDVLVTRFSAVADKVKLVHSRGQSIANEHDLDLILSIGVLHHIENPSTVVAAARRALRQGGLLLIWLYGREGNENYLAFVQPFRALTRRLPHGVLSAICWALTFAADLYLAACRFAPLPMRQYVTEVFARMSRRKRHLIIYDQLNPAYAKYYLENEARELLAVAGFTNIRLHHRHGYSWTVCGER